MAYYLIDPASGRLRAGWRILIFMLLLMGLAMAGQLALKAYFGGIPKTTPYLRNTLLITMAAIAATIAVPVARRLLDRRSFASLGLLLSWQAPKDALFGFVLSAAMAGMVFGIMAATGLITINGINWGTEQGASTAGSALAIFLGRVSLGSLALMLLVDCVVSWWEELVFRGYLLQNMMDGMGKLWAVVLSCVIFGAVHATNPNAGALSTVIIMLFGFLRIYGFLSTRQLWLTLGMHAGWNFFQGPIFGFAASGQASASLVDQVPSGPDWLSGGAFGPEGSILILPVIGLALIAMRWWALRSAGSPAQAQR